MTAEQNSEPKIIVDENWKERVEREREQMRQQPQQPEAPRQPPEPRLPPASFAGLITSLASQAAAALAEFVQPPETKDENQPRLDPKIALEVARHVIDTLGVLEAKTRGNLTNEEAAILEQALHELRMAFVEVQTRRV